MKKDIIWGLKNTEIRLSIGNDKWMFWDEVTKEWVVMVQGYRKRRPIQIIRTENENHAIQSLLSD